MDAGISHRNYGHSIPNTLAVMQCVTFNMADPVFWSRFYPNAASGFEKLHERQRAPKLVDIVQLFLGKYDLVCLQEVPAAMAEHLHALAVSCGFGVGWAQDYCVPDPHNPDASYVALMVKESHLLR